MTRSQHSSYCRKTFIKEFYFFSSKILMPSHLARSSTHLPHIASYQTLKMLHFCLSVSSLLFVESNLCFSVILVSATCPGLWSICLVSNYCSSKSFSLSSLLTNASSSSLPLGCVCLPTSGLTFSCLELTSVLLAYVTIAWNLEMPLSVVPRNGCLNVIHDNMLLHFLAPLPKRV